MNGSRYLVFRLAGQTQKTQIWHIYSKNHGDFLGQIKWFGRWRQYAFFPAAGTIWNQECLLDICEFIRAMMEYRLQGKTK